MNYEAMSVRFWKARCINTSKCLCILSWALNNTKHYLFSRHVLFSLNLFVPFGRSFAGSKSGVRRGSEIHEQNKWYFYRGISVSWGIWLELTWWILIRCFGFIWGHNAQLTPMDYLMKWIKTLNWTQWK